ncbi:pimeloyl-ACP methyl ester carboxylesterase [Streptomyces africanus]|uniref:Pimeloyl-ACP methyl ester carboxylesterase n=1 Tax=Streptomyces africanus TaxID=231024 RepID=A0ABU0QMQ5_9ACTN|nr:alpha/beta fold hydrolase [Streptomyces africanus]MDQ0748668.1 pimeloyl-ACP methyl ester carboxylesterase [Streptomyces africanus]
MRCSPAGPQPAPGESTSPRQDFERSVRAARDLAERCRPAAGLLPHASIRNVARDLDAIRAALGERRMSYYGASYGADLGAVYTQLFPRRVVLDSSTDPARIQYDLFRSAGAALEAGLDEWAG